jgi:hypothetical protein
LTPFPAHILAHTGKWITARAQQCAPQAPTLWIEPDVPIRAGTSGGAVVTEDGQLLGVVSHTSEVHEPQSPPRPVTGSIPRPHLAAPRMARAADAGPQAAGIAGQTRTATGPAAAKSERRPSVTEMLPPPRRARGNGVLYRKGGVYMARLYLPALKKYKKRSTGTADPKQAERFLARWKAEVHGGTWLPDVDKTTFEHLATMLLDDYRANARARWTASRIASPICARCSA